MQDMIAAIRRNALGIGVFAIITAGVIAITQVATSGRIKANQDAAQARALYQIIPKSIDPELDQHKIEINNQALLHLSGAEFAYQAIADGKVKGVILPAIAPDGYSGDIRILVGVFADGSVAGVRVLAHKETPGLGDNIEPSKSNWLDEFVGELMHGADDPSWAVKKDGGRFDQFTGATITPRAVVNAVGRAIQYFEQNRAQLLTPVTGSEQ